MTTPDTEEPGHGIGVDPVVAPSGRQVQRRTLILAVCISAMLLIAVGAFAVWALTTREAPVAATPTSTPAASQPIAPKGELGRLWHTTYRREAWEWHIDKVDYVGPVIIIETDLRNRDEDLDIALEICRAGVDWMEENDLAGIGSGVAVYGASGARLAESGRSSTCDLA